MPHSTFDLLVCAWVRSTKFPWSPPTVFLLLSLMALLELMEIQFSVIWSKRRWHSCNVAQPVGTAYRYQFVIIWTLTSCGAASADCLLACHSKPQKAEHQCPVCYACSVLWLQRACNRVQLVHLLGQSLTLEWDENCVQRGLWWKRQELHNSLYSSLVNYKLAV